MGEGQIVYKLVMENLSHYTEKNKIATSHYIPDKGLIKSKTIRLIEEKTVNTLQPYGTTGFLKQDPKGTNQKVKN